MKRRISKDLGIQPNCELEKPKALLLKTPRYVRLKKNKKDPFPCRSNYIYKKEKSPRAKNQEATENRANGQRPRCPALVGGQGGRGVTDNLRTQRHWFPAGTRDESLPSAH